ncbi:MAG: hypothetical protein M3N54_11150 [Acidobacteriota bacterium]|nr:hypothetical protein [Acidobacteriota bacterium]
MKEEDFFEPPPEMEAFVLAEFDRVQRVRLWQRRGRWCAVGMLAAACVALAILMPRARAPQPQARVAKVLEAAPDVAPARVAVRKKVRAQRRAAPQPAANQTEFVQIPFTMPLAPSERASVLRMEMPVSALIATGVPLFAADAGARAQADVLVGEDGLARAIRVISISNYKEQFQ